MAEEPAALDALDRKVLHALQLDGRASFTHIADVLGVSDQTVARRFRQLRTTAKLRVLGVTNTQRIGPGNWIVRLTCLPGATGQLVDTLARRCDTWHVELLSGGTEAMCGVRPRSDRERDELLLDRLQRTPQLTSVQAYSVLHNYFSGPSGWLTKIRALDPDQEAALRPPLEQTTTAIALDGADESILAALRHDGRISSLELQARTNLSADAVARRLNRLRASGVLYFDVQYNPECLGHIVAAMLWLTVAPSALDQIGRTLARHPQVRYAAATTGRTNLIATTVHRTNDDLYRYVAHDIGALTGVASTEVTPIQRVVKDLDYPAGR